MSSLPQAQSMFLVDSKKDLYEKFFRLETKADIAALLEVAPGSLNFILFVRGNNYQEFNISKRSGAPRNICAPYPSLKIIQQKLNQVLAAVYRPKSAVHGFVCNKNILSNAVQHIDRNFIFNIDILDFFPTINFGRVRGMFMGKPYLRNPEVATLLAQICCHQNSLPQGAPTSPIVSNMICAKLDSNLCRLADENKMHYTRYADDITFSTTKRVLPKSVALIDSLTNQPLAGVELRAIIETNGFKLNDQKIRLRYRDQRQQVTGLIVNKKPNVNRSLYSQVRSMLYAWETYGLTAAQDEFLVKWDRKARRKPQPDFRLVVKGKIDFIGFVRGRDSWQYASLYWKYCELDYKFPWRTIEATENAGIKVFQEALWVIQSEGASGTQGTGFYVKDLGLVTCSHVLEKYSYVHHWRKPKARFDFQVLWEDPQLDLAIIEGLPKQRAVLRIERGSIYRVGDEVTILGFPDYHLGQAPIVTSAHIIGDRVRAGQKQILVSGIILGGNSGGLVLDSKNRLLGIAAHGPEDNAENADKEMSSVISITHLPSKI